MSNRPLNFAKFVENLDPKKYIKDYSQGYKVANWKNEPKPHEELGAFHDDDRIDFAEPPVLGHESIHRANHYSYDQIFAIITSKIVTGNITAEMVVHAYNALANIGYFHNNRATFQNWKFVRDILEKWSSGKIPTRPLRWNEKKSGEFDPVRILAIATTDVFNEAAAWLLSDDYKEVNFRALIPLVHAVLGDTMYKIPGYDKLFRNYLKTHGIKTKNLGYKINRLPDRKQGSRESGF